MSASKPFSNDARPLPQRFLMNGFYENNCACKIFMLDCSKQLYSDRSCLMKIDINQLTEAELIDLNHRIVERLRLLSQMKAHVAMLEFKIGDRVTFQGNAGERIEGILTRYNKKTVTVITHEGRQWNVSPGFLKKIEGLKPELKAIPLHAKRNFSKNKRK